LLKPQLLLLPPLLLVVWLHWPWCVRLLVACLPCLQLQLCLACHLAVPLLLLLLLAEPLPLHRQALQPHPLLLVGQVLAE
jgi:hypothetical protein